MTVFKATRGDMSCTMGKGAFFYHLGVPALADRSACGNAGLHGCEYVLDCARYYKLGDGNRFFLAEARGDIAEDGCDTRIACTELTLIQELTNREIAAHALLYMVKHPRRSGWEAQRMMVDVSKDRAEAVFPDAIAIARGFRPAAMGVMGSHLGLIREVYGEITDARLLTVGRNGVKPGTWYTVEDNMPKEVSLAAGAKVPVHARRKGACSR